MKLSPQEEKNESIDQECDYCHGWIWVGEYLVVSADGRTYCHGCAKEKKDGLEEEFDDLIFGDLKKESPELCKMRIKEIKKEYLDLTGESL